MSTDRSRLKLFWVIMGAYAAMILLIVALCRPPEASGAEKIVREGYDGPERFKTSESPVKGDSGTTRHTGWVGDKRIDLRVVRKNEYLTRKTEYTDTRGWVGDEHVHNKEQVPERASQP